ncbi:hypothetical protein FGRA07_05100 [Fusarium graminearum]|nr:hypothetical protein FGRA07_05100 [Fusarium graminearum]
MKFDEVLQFVSFPDVEVKFTSRHETKMNGKDRRDIKFFFNWLHVKGVRHILRVDVEDSTEFPHSDQAISESFNTITVEQLNWRKVDLDPRVICSLGSKVAWGEAGRISSLTCDCKIREITLTWSGNNTALRAWSEPEGLPLLPQLRKIIILGPDDEEMAESQEWVSACMGEFRQRIDRNVLARDNKSIEKKDEDNDGTSKTKDSSDADTDKRNIEIIFVKRGGKGRILENLDTLGQPQPTVESRAAHRWLDSVYAFANRVNQFWMQSLSAIPPSLHDHMASHVVVALIDDGVQAYGSFLSANITGGKSFATGGTNNMASPWYVSELGHGTVMAETIARVCPMVKLYPMRVDTHTSENGERTLEAKSVALAIDAAIQRGAKIILIPWPIEPTKSSSHKLLHSMLQRAHMLDVLLFIPSSVGEGSQALSTFRSYPTFRIGASRDDGGAVNATDSPSEVDFIFPGNEVMIQRDIDNPRRSGGAIPDLDSSSNINVALAAGLAAVLIYACKLISLKPMLKARSTGEDNDYMNNTYDLTSLRRYRGMMSAFQNLGSVTESRFLKVWEVLDPIVDEMRDSPMENYELKGLVKWFSRLKSIEEITIPTRRINMELRWLILSLFFTTCLAAENSTKPWGYVWNSSHPYWNDEIKPCAETWMPMCYEYIEGEATVPILCECGQDHYENDFLIAFAQCIAKETPENSEMGFSGLQWDCSQEGLSVNMTKREFMRIAEGGEVYPTTSSGLSTGAIAGIAVGAIAAGAAVIGILVWLWLQRRKKNGDKLESNPPSSPKPENSWATEFKPEWTANAPAELPPTNYAAAELPPESAPIYEMDAMPTKPVEMPGSTPEHVKKEENKENKESQ